MLVLHRPPDFCPPKSCDGRVVCQICSSIGRNIHGQPNREAEFSA
jgi:hypothetical protein